MNPVATKKEVAVLLACILPALFCSAQFRPDDITGLTFWIRADSAVTVSGQNVVLWEDVSDSGHDAEQNIAVIQPDFMPDAINGFPAISFDGTDDFMQFPEVNDIRTVFWVVRENPLADPNSPRRSLLGHSGTMYFLRGEQRRLWDPFAGAMVVQGSTRLNFDPVIGTQTALPSGFNLVSLVTTANAAATHLTMDLNIFGRTWWGEIAEIIAYNQPLSPEEVFTVESYLADKYTPDFSAIDDVIVPYGFCDTTICATAGMASYLWSDGSTGSCLTVSQDGVYSVEMTDAFGRLFLDSVEVFYPGNRAIPDTLICAGNIFGWNTELSEEDYSFSWSGGASGPVPQWNEEGLIAFQIADTLGCTFSGEFTISVDDFPLADILLSQYALCAGNTIDVVPIAGGTVVWSDGSDAWSLPVFNSGSVQVTVTNVNGCINEDEAQCDVVGVAPEIDVTSGIACEDSPVEFSASASELIETWTWNFGNGPIPGTVITSHTWNEPGVYACSVTATSPNGCSGTEPFTVVVHPKPVASVAFSAPCENIPVHFESATGGGIADWIWNIGGQEWSGAEVEFTFTGSGPQLVNLQVIDTTGCGNAISVDLFILPSPVAEITYEENCFGDLVQFDATVDVNGSGSILAHAWQFGDNSESAVADPSHFYAAPGTYTVNYQVIASNGCSASASLDIVLNLPPAVDFETSAACIGQPFELIPEVLSQPGDEVEWYEWIVDGVMVSNDILSEVVFEEDGFHSIQLSVRAASGCEASVTQQVVAWPSPVAAFEYSPVPNAPLYTYQFTNLSNGVNLIFNWNFGSSSSSATNPLVQFTVPGELTVSLQATSLQGCSNLSSQVIAVSAPQLDLAITRAELVSASSGLSRIELEVRNQGNVPVPALRGSWQGGGELVITQDWPVALRPGESSLLIFESAFDTDQLALDYFCAHLSAPDVALEDAHPDDNQMCKSLGKGGLELYPPFPNPGDTHMILRCVTGVPSNLEIQLFDNSGNLVKYLEDLNVKKGFHQYFIDISDLASGAYTLSVVSGGQRKSAAFQKINR
jgi:PKD repeat protein